VSRVWQEVTPPTSKLSSHPTLPELGTASFALVASALDDVAEPLVFPIPLEATHHCPWGGSQPTPRSPPQGQLSAGLGEGSRCPGYNSNENDT
jgi:hypothetical protein